MRNVKQETTSITGQVWQNETWSGRGWQKSFIVHFDSFADIRKYEQETGCKVEPLQFVVTRGIGDVDVYEL